MKNHWLNKEIDLDIDTCDFADFQASACCWDEFETPIKHSWGDVTIETPIYYVNCGTASIIPDNLTLAEESLTVFESDEVVPEPKVEENKIDFLDQIVVDRDDLGFDIYHKWSSNGNNRTMAAYLNGVEEKQLLNWLLEKHTGHKNLLDWLILKTENNE